MLKKALIGGFTVATLTLILGACGSGNTNNSQNSSSMSSSSMSSSSMSSSESTSGSMNSGSESMGMSSVGQIVGSYDSSDGKVMGATKPGEQVKFEVPARDGEEYLHLAFMHAASGDKGWYFAPESEDGIALSKSMFDGNSSVDITDKMGLFAAPNATTSEAVTADDGDLKYVDISEFMKATVMMENDMYVVTIENMSSGDHETPFSSGVWEVTDTKGKSFDHTASKELSALATMGHREDLYKMVEKEAK